VQNFIQIGSDLAVPYEGKKTWFGVKRENGQAFGRIPMQSAFGKRLQSVSGVSMLSANE